MNFKRNKQTNNGKHPIFLLYLSLLALLVISGFYHEKLFSAGPSSGPVTPAPFIDEDSTQSDNDEVLPAWSQAGAADLPEEQSQSKPQVQPTVSPTPAPVRDEVTLLAVGDNLIHREVVASGKKKDGTYNYDHLYSNLKEEISAADIAVVNQETIFGGAKLGYSGYPRFNSPEQIGDAILGAGFDVVLQATNHTLDMGESGLENATAYWKTKPGITVLGINESAQAREQIPIVTKNGIKIAMLNYTYSLNGFSLPKDKPYLVNMLDKDKMAEDIARAKEEADFIIVFPHWGTEYSYTASSMQEELTDFFYDQGVDLIIGSHPHVIEPVEWIEKEAGHRMLVYYSLGNFISYQREAPRMLGAMANVTIVKDDGGTYIASAGITPIVTHYENGPSDYHYAIYKLADYTPELAAKHGVADVAVNGPLDYQKTLDLAKSVLGSWYHTDQNQ